VNSDRTLYDLITKSPADEAALLEVFGMGRIKAARFGKSILDTIAKASVASDSIL
jgi:superfamily II DNA helicase RecQ